MDQKYLWKDSYSDFIILKKGVKIKNKFFNWNQIIEFNYPANSWIYVLIGLFSGFGSEDMLRSVTKNKIFYSGIRDMAGFQKTLKKINKIKLLIDRS